MLYLLRTEGRLEELQEATDAYLDEENGTLVCVNETGEVVSRYSRYAVVAFSRRPVPPLVDNAGNSRAEFRRPEGSHRGWPHQAIVAGTALPLVIGLAGRPAALCPDPVRIDVDDGRTA